MPHIIPMKDLCKTNQVSELCHSTNKPVFVTKNGYANLVIMSAEVYESTIAKLETYTKLVEGMQDVKEKRVKNAYAVLDGLENEFAK